MALWSGARRTPAAMKINESAPAVGSAEIVVAADPEVVWEVLAAIEDWPSWNPDVTSASLEGGLTEGSTFRWKAGSATITSTLQRVERPRLIAWTGKALGLRAIHVYRLEAHGPGTFVSTAESWDGPVARVFRKRMQETMSKAIEAGLGYLKAEAERRAS
jgi:polyketide cyclase/dehydrase/lipid transport protein